MNYLFFFIHLNHFITSIMLLSFLLFTSLIFSLWLLSLWLFNFWLFNLWLFNLWLFGLWLFGLWLFGLWSVFWFCLDSGLLFLFCWFCIIENNSSLFSHLIKGLLFSIFLAQNNIYYKFQILVVWKSLFHYCLSAIIYGCI